MRRWAMRSVVLAAVLVGLLFQQRAGAVKALQEPTETVFLPMVLVDAYGGDPRTLYIPTVLDNAPWDNPFSAETWGTYVSYDGIQQKIKELRMEWIRYYGLSWRAVQPEEGGPYDWNSATIHRMDTMLMEANKLGLEPAVIIQDSPHWATVEPTSCAAIRTDKLDDFADFVAAVVERYSQPPYNVHVWEIGNEPDVDPQWVAPDSGFGCWGDIDDYYYGGEQYGEMLKVVTPAIRAVDPFAKVVIGGLLLDTPLSTDPNAGNPERFFEGILVAGAAPYLDVVAYHDHYSYTSMTTDYGGNYPGSKWEAWGGQTIGKPTFLRSIMATYGVSKPLWLNESTLRCPTNYLSCQGDLTNFNRTQARFLVREMARSFTAKAERFSWYTLHGPAWQFSGLLDGFQEPKAAFEAFDTMVDQIYGSTLPPVAVDYGNGLEAYRFDKPHDPDVDVIFAPAGVYQFATVPVEKFVAAYNIYGEVVGPGQPINGNYQFFVGYEPVYLHRHP